MNRGRIIGLFVLSAMLIACADRKDAEIGKIPQRGFLSIKPAGNWEEALVTGNGTMGAMVMGHPYHDTLILNHALLYLPLNRPLEPVSQGKHLQQIRNLMLEGRYGEASQYVVGLSHEEGWKGKRWTDPYIPAFDITIGMEEDSVEEYARTVDFQSGEAGVKWKDSRGIFSRSTFVSRTDNMVVTRIVSNGPAFDCTVGVNERHRKTWWADILGIEDSGISDSRIHAGGNHLTFRAVFENQWEGLISGYEGAVLLRNTGGRLVGKENGFAVEGTRELLILARLVPLYDTQDTHLPGLMATMDGETANYVKLLARHREVHGELFNRTKLELYQGKEKLVPVEEWLGMDSRKPDPRLIELEFDAARYNIISSTGINPPNLQGIWSGTLTPPWSSDFTMNGNVPVAVSSMLPANMPELMIPLFDLLEIYLPDFEKNAKQLFGCRGIHIPSRMSTHGLNNHFDATWPMTFWTGGAGWYSMFYYDYFLHTGDTAFLRQRALPFMEKALLFYEDFLTEGPDVYLLFNPSYSPENNPGNIPCQACINATMDVMIAKQLLRNTMEASELLKVNREKISLWRSMLKKMPPYELNEKGELREWMWPGVEENHRHRHVSHLYALFDLIDPEFRQNPELKEGAVRVLEEKMKVRRQDEGGVMAFGLAQMAFAAAMLGEADACYEMLGWLTRNYWKNNMVTTHDPGSIFNLDLSGGYPVVVIKMLVYSEPGLISLFPALPSALSTGTIKGVRLRGNVMISEMNWDRKNIRLQLLPGTDRKVLLKLPGEIDAISCRGGNITVSGKPGERWLEMREGSPVRIRIALKEPCYIKTLRN